MTTTYPAPGSSTPGAPPPLRRALVAADGTSDATPLGARTLASAETDHCHAEAAAPTTSDTHRLGLLVGLGLAVAALVVELSGRRHTHRP